MSNKINLELIKFILKAYPYSKVDIFFRTSISILIYKLFIQTIFFHSKVWGTKLIYLEISYVNSNMQLC